MTGEIKDRGFIVRLIPAQEADVVVRILTSKGEKFSAFAKAGLKSKKRFAGALEPLLHIEYRATKRRAGGIFQLEEARVRHDFQLLKSNLDRLTAASYAAEIIEYSAQEGLEHVEIYNLFGATLKALEVCRSPSAKLRQFEVKLLAILGWLPTFHFCASCTSARESLFLNPLHGIVMCGPCGAEGLSLSPDTQDVLGHLLQKSIMKTDFGDTDVALIQPITSALLQAHWGQHQLKSVQFLGSLHRFQE